VCADDGNERVVVCVEVLEVELEEGLGAGEEGVGARGEGEGAGPFLGEC
jgi:hypothetical protein